MRRVGSSNGRAGFSLLETLIGVSILGLIIGNVYMLQSASSEAYESGVFGSALEDGAEATMDRIALAVMSSSAEQLDEVLTAPLFVSQIDYEVITDVVEGETIVSAPERIEFISERGEIVWSRDPSGPDQLELVWSRWVPDMLEGEVPNGSDDNQNGIADEEGLAFNRDANQILIRLTVSRTDSNDVVYTRTRSRRVTCRN